MENLNEKEQSSVDSLKARLRSGEITPNDKEVLLQVLEKMEESVKVIKGGDSQSW